MNLYESAIVTAGSESSSTISFSGSPMWSVSSGSTERESNKNMRYLYKAYVVDFDDNIFESGPLIAKDEVGAKVKAILKSGIDPDNVNVVIVEELGEVPEVDDEE